LSVDTSARPPTRATGTAPLTLLLQEHRDARLDQVTALTFAGTAGHDLDPAARLQALAAARETLDEIDAALLRLDDGSYGLCQGCAERIVAERLLLVPYARHCSLCALPD
jgi:RNA polymerase-binding transcription factor DksA